MKQQEHLITKEVLVIKFEGQNHQVDTQIFAYSVLNFASVIEEINKAQKGGTA